MVGCGAHGEPLTSVRYALQQVGRGSGMAGGGRWLRVHPEQCRPAKGTAFPEGSRGRWPVSLSHCRPRARRSHRGPAYLTTSRSGSNGARSAGERAPDIHTKASPATCAGQYEANDSATAPSSAAAAPALCRSKERFPEPSWPRDSSPPPRPALPCASQQPLKPLDGTLTLR